MLKGVQSTDLKVNAHLLPKNDHAFEHVRSSKFIEEVNTNTYHTEDEKWQITNAILTNQENFTIFFRILATLEQHKTELCYLLGQILSYTTSEMSTKIKGSTSHEGIL